MIYMYTSNLHGHLTIFHQTAFTSLVFPSNKIRNQSFNLNFFAFKLWWTMLEGYTVDASEIRDQLTSWGIDSLFHLQCFKHHPNPRWLAFGFQQPGLSFPKNCRQKFPGDIFLLLNDVAVVHSPSDHRNGGSWYGQPQFCRIIVFLGKIRVPY